MATPMKAQPARPSDAPTERKDVVRNRQKIVDAARELFTDQHPLQVQLDDVAELAGVSRATLFRHIGSRHELIAMVYRDRLADIMDLTDAAAAMDDPWQSLELCIRTLVDWLHTDRRLVDFVSMLDPSFFAGAEWAVTFEQLNERLDGVLARADAAGALAAPVRGADLLPLISFARSAGTREGTEQRLDFYTDVLLRGLQA